TSLITGIGIDTWLFLLGDWIVPGTLLGQSICLGIGIVFTCLGVSFYLQSKIAPNPMDRSMLVVSNLTGWSVTYSRALISVVFVVFAFLFVGTIGIGTLINGLFYGMLINMFLPFTKTLNKGTEKHTERAIS